MYTVLVVKLVVLFDSVTMMGFVLIISVELATGCVKMLVSTVVLVSVVGTVIMDD